jgi:hypothetical protein
MAKPGAPRRGPSGPRPWPGPGWAKAGSARAPAMTAAPATSAMRDVFIVFSLSAFIRDKITLRPHCNKDIADTVSIREQK